MKASIPLAGVLAVLAPTAWAQGPGTSNSILSPLPTQANPASSGSATSGQTVPPSAPDDGSQLQTGGAVSFDIDIVAKRLDIARDQIQPSLGASVYGFSRLAIEGTPQSDNNRLNQIVLQAPSVAQDSFGQLHVRGDHANLQYRINGVQLPEGISVFGQILETRLANSASLITGALPAQYGFRTAGVIDIQTKTGTLNPGGAISMYGGSRDTLQPSIEYGGHTGRLDYFATGEFLHNDIGIENPTRSRDPLHDTRDQGRGFLYLSAILNESTRLSLIAGTARNQFQIPDTPGLTPQLGLTVNGQSTFDSAALDESQREISHFAVLSLQKQFDAADLQVSAFNRYSSVTFAPDYVGDLLFNGLAQSAYRRDIATGVQTDGSWRIAEDHTLRSGFLIQGERATAQASNFVLPVDGTGAQTTDQPLSFLNTSAKTGYLYGVYLQDEWRPLTNLTVNFGGRFDLVDAYTHENQISPRFNVVYQPFGQTTIHAGYSKYFTPPPLEIVTATSIANLNGTTGQAPVTTGNNVKAERADYFDGGIDQVVLPGFKVGIDAYFKHSKNLIDEGQFGTPVILSAYNYAIGFAKGVELTSSYTNGNFDAYGNFAVSKSTGKKIVSSQFLFGQDDLDYIATNAVHTDHDQTYTASGGVSYRIGNARLSADLLHGSGLRADGDHPNGRSVPDYTQVNLGATYTLPGQGLQFRFDIVNLFDEIYQVRDGSGIGVVAAQYGPRRGFFGGMTKTF